MLVSCLTLLNSKSSGAYYAASLVPAYAVLLVSVVMAVRVAGGSAEGVGGRADPISADSLPCAGPVGGG